MERDLDQATAELGQALAEWRAAHRAPARIPVELWARAADLAAQQGVCKTARALGLGYKSLKKRMVTAVEPLNASFVEWLSPVSANIRECALIIESSRGAKMRLEMRDVPPAGVAAIVRDFVG